MKILKPLCLSMAFCLGTLNATQAANDSALVSAIYSSAKNNNRQSLYRIRKNGYSLDAVDTEGNTALCRALKNKDYRAYELLRVMGANPNHPCVKRLEAKAAESSSNGIAWRPSNYTYTAIGAVAFGGLAIAAAAGGGGGGGSSDNAGAGNGGTNNPSGGDTPSGGDDPSGGNTSSGGDNNKPGEGDTALNVWDTEEYRQGGFLQMINAANAYENLASQKIELEKVKVGIIDDGLDNSNKEFDGQNITGFNYDYGPCRNGDKTSCWEYDGTKAVLWNQPNSEAGIASTVVDSMVMDRDEYNTWASQYPADYDWNNVNHSFAPLEGSQNMHGTHVAGIISANRDGDGMHGVTTNAELIVARRDLSDLDQPMTELIKNGARVINMSIGADSTTKVNASTINQPEVQGAMSRYLNIFRYAKQNDTVLVIAAGNEHQPQSNVLAGIPLLSEYFDAESGKSTYKTMINVVALDENGRLASYSNSCGATKDYCLAAPGTNITSTGTYGKDYTSMSGTSMAAPVVTGSVALLMGAYPYMTGEQIVSLLLDTATDIPANDENIPDGVDTTYGHGLINLNNATQPQGELTLAAENSVNGRKISFNQTQISVPAVFQNSLAKNMPKSITVFDKYNRPFEAATSALVRKTHNGERNFRQDLYAFSRRLPRRHIDASQNLSFGFAPSDIKADGSLGFVDVAYRNDKHKTSFFFSENTKYNHDTFSDTALFNPYLAMNQAYGVRNSYEYNAGLGFSMGFTAGENGLYDGDVSENDRDFDNMSYAFDTSVSYKATDTVMVTAMSGLLFEDEALLGLNGSGAFGIGNSNTYYAGLSIAWAPTAKWKFSGAYYQGWTQSKNLNSSMMQTSNLASDSFALDGRYALNKTDIIGFQVSSPLRVYQGKARFNLPVGRDDYSDTVYREQYIASMKPNAREYKFSLYHSREINEDMGLRAQFDVRLNPDHQKEAATDYRMMFNFNWTL